jgi:tRNA (cmo5U34)-methyltransferase
MPSNPIHLASEYDQNIRKMLPHYTEFHDSVINLIQHTIPSPEKWLDTGCGTATLAARLLPLFPKTAFFLSDPSLEMLAAAKEKINAENVSFISGSSQELDFEDNTFDVITAVLSHHYLSKEERQKAVSNCFRMLKPGGFFVYFEHVRPFSEKGIRLALQRWHQFQIKSGRTDEEAKQHTGRFDEAYFPVTVTEHLDLLKETGFECAEILWLSYMQGGFYAVK